MTKLVCCTSAASSVGCTFLDWSIHFLSGKNKFLNSNAKGWLDLVSDPLVNNNAHAHKKNHPSGFKETESIIKFLKEYNELVSYYPFPIRIESAGADVNIHNVPTNSDEWQRIRNYQKDDYNRLLKYSESESAKIIFISLDNSLILYHRFTRSLDRLIYTNRPAKSIEEVRDTVDSLFFKESVEYWDKLGLNNIWDKRERLALCTRPLDHSDLIAVDFSFDHYWLDSRTWWQDGKRQIREIMNWLDISIDPNRFDTWITIYQNWQAIQFKALDFQYNCKHIIDCIINDWSYDIDLTFDQEIVIQHCLIYQHGLNLKTWQLEKFPKNTQDLHQLLEPNIHKI